MPITLPTFRRLFLAAAALLAASSASALSSTPPALPGGSVVYAASGFNDFYTSPHPDMTGRLYKIDATNGASLGSIPLWCQGKFYGNNNGLARHPITGMVYGVFTLDAQYESTQRYLCTVNLVTGQITPVGGKIQNMDGTGPLGIAAIAFDAGGSLFGIEGNGDRVFAMDTVSGQARYLFSGLSTGDGAALAFNPSDDQFYLLSGTNLTRFDAGGAYIQKGTGVYQDMNAYAMASVGSDWFLAAREGDINGYNLWAVRSDGNALSLGRLPDNVKGMVIAPDVAFAAPAPTVTTTPLNYGGKVFFTVNQYSNFISQRNSDGTDIGKIYLSNPLQNVSSGFNTLAKSPAGVVYGALQYNGSNTCRGCLATVDLNTGSVSPIGLIDSNTRIHAMDFTADGRLWATVGQQSPQRDYLYKVNPTNAQGDPYFNLRTLDPGLSSYGKVIAADPTGTKLIIGGQTNAGYRLFLFDPDTKAFSALNTKGTLFDMPLHTLAHVSGNSYVVVSRNNSAVQAFDYGTLTFGAIVCKLNGDSGLLVSSPVTYKTPTPTNTYLATNTDTATFTPTRTWTPLPTDTFTVTDTNTGTVSPSSTPTATRTPTRTDTPTRTYTPTLTFTPHPSFVQTLYVLSNGGSVLSKFDADSLAAGNTTPLLSQSLTLPYGSYLKGLAKHPSNGLYYTLIMGAMGQDRDLATIDLDSGAISIIGNTGLNLISLAFTPDGNLWAISGNNTYPGQLFTLDISSGKPTFRADYKPQTDGYTRALAYDSARSRLMMLTLGKLYSIDPNTLDLQTVSANVVGMPAHPMSLYFLGSNLALEGDHSGYVNLMTANGTAVIATYSLGGDITGIVSGPDYAFTTTLTPSATPTPYPTPAGAILAGSGSDLYVYDPISFGTLNSVGVQLPRISVGSILGLAKHPTTGVLYALIYANTNKDDRRLITLDPSTGAAQPVASLDDYYATMAFDGGGNLYLATSSGGSVPNKLYRYDWDNNVALPLKSLPGTYETGRSYDGLALAFDPDDGKLYFLGQERSEGTTIFGRYDLSDLSYQPLTIKGSAGTKIKGLTYYGYGVFYAADNDDNAYTLSTTGDFVTINSGGAPNLKGMLYGPIPTIVAATPTETPTPYPTPSGLMYYSVNSNGYLVQTDPNTGYEDSSVRIKLGTRAVQNAVGLARNPVNGEYFAVVNFNSYYDRVLVKLDPATGVATAVGATNHMIDALAFDNTGTLYGASAKVDGPANSLYRISTTTAACTFLRQMPNVANGVRYNYNALAHNPDDGRLYWAARTNNMSHDHDIFGSFDLGNYAYRELFSDNENVESAQTRSLVYYNGVFYGMRDDARIFILDPKDGHFTPSYGGGSGHAFGGALDVARTFTAPTATATGTPFPTPVNSIYAFASNTVNFYEMDGTGAVLGGYYFQPDPAYPNFTKILGAAKHPNGTIYVVAADGVISQNDVRRLFRVSFPTAKMTYVGQTAGNLINLAFAPDGTLYGLTGNNSTSPGRAVVTVNINTGATTFRRSMVDSMESAGGALAYNSDDGKLYVVSTLNGLNTFGRLTLPSLSYEALTISATTSNWPRALTYYAYGIFYLQDQNGTFYTLNVNGSLDEVGSSFVRAWGMFMAPHVDIGTVTVTSTITPTSTVTETANGTFTETPTFSVSPTFTPSVTVSETAVDTATSTRTPTPTFSNTPNLSDTVTATRTISATLTVTKTATRVSTLTATRTFQPTRTATATNTATTVPTAGPNTVPAYLNADGVLGGNLGISMGAVKKGEDLCLGFAGRPDKTDIELYNFGGERVVISDLSGSRQCIQTGSLAPGVYFLRMKITLADGRTQDRWQRVAILPQ